MSLAEEDLTRHRTDDHASSVDGARAAGRKAPTQQLRMLVEWARVREWGFTDEEAAAHAGIDSSSNYWKRAGELRAKGLIRWHPEGERREGESGVFRKVSVITEMGRRELRAHGVEA